MPAGGIICARIFFNDLFQGLGVIARVSKIDALQGKIGGSQGIVMTGQTVGICQLLHIDGGECCIGGYRAIS